MDLREFLAAQQNKEDTKFTPEQFKRQWDRCKEAVLVDLINYEDGSYRGEIKPEFRDIIYKDLKLDERLDEEAFTEMLSKISVAMIRWILDETVGVSSEVASAFVSDFLSKIMQTMFSVQEMDTEEGADPMFG